VKLIIQPDDGIAPLLRAARLARRRIDIAIFRFDRPELQKALAAAVARGVVVRALIAHTNSDGDKRLRKLELQLLDDGVTVSRTADDLPRYHGKMLIADDTLYVLGFNYTRLDIEKSRSFGIVTREAQLVQAAGKLFEADSARQPYEPATDRLVLSPENSRAVLASFLEGARQELLVYDEKLTDARMLRILEARRAAGVNVRIIGKLGKAARTLTAEKLPGLRLHVRAIVRDGREAFVGSQSLRRLELDRRRELGLLVRDRNVVARLQAVFESDWAQTAGGKARAAHGVSVEAAAETG
jgi:phosphatidylserine/phosphatidylglycerophosphate/cardiolipin synthase-like enzyme